MKKLSVFSAVCGASIIFAAPAAAYTGPGLGAGVIAVVIGFFASIFVALFAVVWYPIKRLLKKSKKTGDAVAQGEKESVRELSENSEQDKDN